jgi:hypothetical protein
MLGFKRFELAAVTIRSINNEIRASVTNPGNNK